MDQQLLKQLSRITDEERNILNGGKLDMSVYSDNMLFGKLESLMEYNDKGFCSGMTLAGEARATVLRFEHTLDSQGNWTERLTYQDGGTIPTKIERREIKYAD